MGGKFVFAIELDGVSEKFCAHQWYPLKGYTYIIRIHSENLGPKSVKKTFHISSNQHQIKVDTKPILLLEKYIKLPVGSALDRVLLCLSGNEMVGLSLPSLLRPTVSVAQTQFSSPQP